MRILFVMAYPGYLRYFSSTVRMLLDRGHHVTLAFSDPDRQAEGLEAVSGGHEGLTCLTVPKRRYVWREIARKVRRLADFFRYLDPQFSEARFLRSRAARAFSERLEFLARMPALPGWALRGALWALRQLEECIPPSRRLEQFIASTRADALVLSPLVTFGSAQTDLLKTAHKMGLPVGLAVASWDHLTTKGLIRLQPDRVYVWNAAQAQEAVELHSVDRSRIVMTGAQPFDGWFERPPSTTRETFCRSAGLDPAKPFLLFVGSTASISAPEAEVAFVRKWIAAIRENAEGELRDAGILIRPHPYNAVHWRDVDLQDMPNVAIYPREGANPVDEGDRSVYFDSLYHSAVVVGINTSAMIEATIVGRPVHTILAPEFTDTQVGTLHFRYLLPEHGGFVRVARTMAEHLKQLGETLSNPSRAREETTRFVKQFIRPQGLDEPCTPRLVEAIEGLKHVTPLAAARRPVWLLPVQGMLWCLGMYLTFARKVAKRRKDVDDRHPRPAKKILFLTGHFAFLRNFESVLRLLAQRGYAVHLAADREDEMGGERLVAALAAEHPTISYAWTPDRGKDLWLEIATAIRLSLDYLRFLRPEYRGTPFLVGRARRRTPGLIVLLTRVPGLRSASGIRILERLLRLMERALPRRPVVEDFLRRAAPDVVLITPLLGLGSDQYDYLAGAKALGLRTILCVTSWDHLSSKALIRDLPDRVMVWNEIQKREAVRLHGVPRERVAITGAQCYDQWFDWTSSTTREAFCHRVGLDPQRPFLLYLCSAVFKGTGSEAEFVRQWVAGIRASTRPALRRIGVLIRPHPARITEWRTTDLSTYENVAVWPPAGANPIDERSRADYFDSMYHSTAIVGLNTSALIEAGIVDRPVLTILTPDLAQSQVGTLHFHYLLREHGGLLHSAATISEHLEQLVSVMEDGAGTTERNRRFVASFVRPHGLDKPATPVFVDAVEQVAALGPTRPVRMPIPLYPARVLLYIVAGIFFAGRRLGVFQPVKQKPRKRKASRAAARAVPRGEPVGKS